MLRIISLTLMFITVLYSLLPFFKLIEPGIAIKLPEWADLLMQGIFSLSVILDFIYMLVVRKPAKKKQKQAKLKT